MRPIFERKKVRTSWSSHAVFYVGFTALLVNCATHGDREGYYLTEKISQNLKSKYEGDKVLCSPCDGEHNGASF